MLKNKIFVALTWVFLVGLSLGFQEGCLKTLTSKSCMFCDITQSYYLTTNQDCKKQVLENCKVAAMDGSCFLCETGFFYDQSQKKCVQVTANNLIKNCVSYSTYNSCSECDLDYYNATSSCIKIENKIDQCTTYSSKTRCKICASGYIPNISQSLCVKIDKQTSNCIGYNFIQCRSCLPGYILNKSYYSNFLTKDTVIFKNGIDEIYRVLSKQQKSIYIPTCQKIETDPNCVSIYDYQTCKLCKERFFLNQKGICQAYPDVVISNCKTYKSLTQCGECSQGYHLSDTFLCVKDSDFPNCKTFVGNQLKTTCVECNDGFYLYQKSSCVARNNTIENCSVYNPESDQCLKCDSGFATQNFQKCFQEVKNCILYINTDP